MGEDVADDPLVGVALEVRNRCAVEMWCGRDGGSVLFDAVRAWPREERFCDGDGVYECRLFDPLSCTGAGGESKEDDGTALGAGRDDDDAPCCEWSVPPFPLSLGSRAWFCCAVGVFDEGGARRADAFRNGGGAEPEEAVAEVGDVDDRRFVV